MIKKICGYVMIILLFGGAICGIVYGIKYVQVKNSVDYAYSTQVSSEIEKYRSKIDELLEAAQADAEVIIILEEQMKQANENLTLRDKTIETLKEQKNVMQVTIDDLQEKEKNHDLQVSVLEAEKQKLKEDNASNVAEINHLNETIEQLKLEKQALTELKNQYIATVNTLNLSIEALTEEKNVQAEIIKTLNTQVENLQNTILSFQSDIEKYKQIIEDLKNQNTFVVTFSVKDIVVETQQVKKTESPVAVTDPSDDSFIFNGWKIKGTTEIVDPTTISITQNMEFVADISEFNQVTFIVNDKVINTQTVLTGEFSKNVVVENTEDYVFDYWMLNNEKVENVETNVIRGATSYVAKLRFYKTVTFKNGETIVSAEKVLEGDKVSVIPTVEYNTELQTFVGWTLNDVVIDVSIYLINVDVTFFASFETKQIAMKNFAVANELGIKEYYLYDSEDLNTLSEIVNNGNALAGYTIFLANDIDLKDKVFTSIAPYTSGSISQKYFSGNIDGQNFSIYNLKSSTYGFIGNYQSQGNSYIKNLHLKNVNIETDNNVGGLIYDLTYKNEYLNSVQITNCSITGNIKSTSNSAAGLIYDAILNTNSTISKCWNGATVVAYRSASGLIGNIGSASLSSDKVILTDCFNVGNIQTLHGSAFDQDFHASGLIGTFSDNSAKYVLSINNCYNSGNITGKTFVGGLVGYVFKGELKLNNCFVLGSLDAEKNTDLTMARIGGLIGTKGSKSSVVSINNCFVNVNASAYLDAIVGYVRKSDGSGGATSDTTKSTFGTCINTYYGDGLQTLIKTAKQDVSINSDSFKNIEMPVYSTWDFESVWKMNVEEFPTFQEVE